MCKECDIKITRKMAKKSKANMNKMLAVVGGAVAGFFINPAINSVASKVAPGSSYTGKLTPLAKVGLGYLAITRGKGWIADAGLGMIALGGLETAQAFAPEQFKVNGIGAYYGAEGGMYAEIAGDYDYLKPGNSMEEDHVEDIHAVYGMDGEDVI